MLVIMAIWLGTQTWRDRYAHMRDENRYELYKMQLAKWAAEKARNSEKATTD